MRGGVGGSLSTAKDYTERARVSERGEKRRGLEEVGARRRNYLQTPK